MASENWDDFIDQAGEKFNSAPEGEYEFVIKSAEAGVAKSSGNPKITVKLSVAEGPHSGKGVGDVHVVKSAKAASIFLRHLQAVGISPDTLREQKPTLAQIAKTMEGKRVRGKVVHETSERFGTQAKIEWNMRPPTGGAVAVTAFPAMGEADELGYNSGSNGSAPVAVAEDAGF